MNTVRANGAEIPVLGFGTFRMTEGEAERMVEYALGTGYRHIDTARMYDNEAGVGRAIERSGVERLESFLTTKVWPDEFDRDSLPGAVDDSLKNLKTDYVDLLLLHWPNSQVPLSETMEAMNAVQQAGKVRHIGVSNFNVALLEEARQASSSPLVADQVEYHPFIDQGPVLDAVRNAGMTLTAYSPLAQGRVPRDGTLKEIASAHGKNPAQVTLRWLIQQDQVTAIPKASDEEHCDSNLDIFDFELSREEMERIDELAHPEGRIVSPSGLAPQWDS